MSNNKQTPLQSFLTALVDLEIGKNFYIKQHQDLQDAYKKSRIQEEKCILNFLKQDKKVWRKVAKALTNTTTKHSEVTNEL